MSKQVELHQIKTKCVQIFIKDAQSICVMIQYIKHIKNLSLGGFFLEGVRDGGNFSLKHALDQLF